MICSVFITLLGLAIAAASLDWYDRFHVLVGVPMLVLVAFAGYLIRKRSEDEDFKRDPDDRPGIAQRVFIGAVSGGLAIGMLTGSFHLASGIGLKDVIEGPDCRLVVNRLQDFARIKAYTGLVADVDVSLQKRWAPTCQTTLREWKVRALLDWAAQAPAPERLGLIERAVDAASTTPDVDLQGRATWSLRAEKQRLEDEKQRRKAEIARREAEERQRKAELEQKEIEAALERQRQRNEELEKLAEFLGRKGFPVEVTDAGLKIILVGTKALRFAPNQAELNDRARASIRYIAEQLSREPFSYRRIRVIGHTDSSGNHHMALSKARAQSVTKELQQHGIRAERLEVEGKGDQEPIEGNRTSKERAQNRRVEIIVQKG